VLDPTQAEWQTIRVGRSPHGIFFKPRREGMAGDFAWTQPGAASGSRPLAVPAQRRAAEAAPAVPAPAAAR
jgi:hypothetical protein